MLPSGTRPCGCATLKASVLEELLMHMNRTAMHCLDYSSRRQGLINDRWRDNNLHTTKEGLSCLFSECGPVGETNPDIWHVSWRPKKHEFSAPDPDLAPLRKRARARLVGCLTLADVRVTAREGRGQ
jgi:hypothetical protein